MCVSLTMAAGLPVVGYLMLGWHPVEKSLRHANLSSPVAQATLNVPLLQASCRMWRKKRSQQVQYRANRSLLFASPSYSAAQGLALKVLCFATKAPGQASAPYLAAPPPQREHQRSSAGP